MDMVEIGNIISNIEKENFIKINKLNFSVFNIWKIFRNSFCSRLYGSIDFPKKDFIKKTATEAKLSRNLRSCVKKATGKIVLRTSTVLYNQKREGKIYSRRLDALTRKFGASNVFRLIDVKTDVMSEYNNLYPSADLDGNFITGYIGLMRYLLMPVVFFHAVYYYRIVKDMLGMTLGRTVHLTANFVSSYIVWYLFYYFARPEKVIFLYASYGHEGEIAALKSLRIRAIEYQHGSLFKEHSGYNYHPALKGIKDKMLLPDKFYVFGEYWKNILIGTGFFSDKDVADGGHIDFENLESVNIDTNGRTPVLICSSANHAPMFRSFLDNYLKMSSYANSYYFIVKKHPRERGSGWEEFVLGRDNVEVSGISTYNLLDYVDVQVTASFTMHEGLYFGVTNYLLLLSVKIDESDVFQPHLGKTIDENYVGPLEKTQIDEKVRNLYFTKFNMELCRDNH